MQEIYPNIFQEIITYPDRHTSPRNLYIVRQPGRSLMVDTSFRQERDWKIICGMVEALEIDYRELDVFITHNHPDHTGLVPDLQALGARVFMNPKESRIWADLLHSYLSDEEERIRNLRTMGVTEDGTPDVYRTFMDYTTRAYAERKEVVDIDFIPITPGEIMEYGDYHFQVISLKGHTAGQCGLFEREHKLMFCGDQIMRKIVPIVISQQKDMELLKCYMESLKQMIYKYGDCRILSCHYDEIQDLEKEVDRIVFGYLDKCSIMVNVLKEHGQWMTTRDIGVRAYGRSQGPPDYQHFISCTQIWAKTFSCMEFMYGVGFVDRMEYNGTIYWKAK